MPLDPIISRGVAPVDVSNTLLSIARMQQFEQESARRDKYQNALLTRANRHDMRERMSAEDAEREAAEVEEMKMLYPLVKAGDPGAISTAIERVAQSSPAAAEALRADPSPLARVMAQQLGIKEPGEIGSQSIPGYGTVVTQGGEITHGRPTPAPHAPREPRQPSEYELYQRDPEAYAAFKKAGRTESRSGEDGGGFKSADTNAIRGLVATAFGGSYDPVSGNIMNIKKEDARNLNRVTAVASALFARNPEMSHAEAVEAAFSEFDSSQPIPEAKPDQPGIVRRVINRVTGQAEPGTEKAPAQPGKRANFASQEEAQAALDSGALQVGDTVYINGQPAFRVEP